MPFKTFTPSQALLIAYFGGNLAILLWNVFAAKRIVHDRRAPRVFVVLTALGSLLILPAILVAISGASVVYGRVIQPIAWIWPATAMLFTIQAGYSLIRRMVVPFFGLPIFAYNLVIAAVATSHFLNGRDFLGDTLNEWLLILSSAQASALGHIVGQDAISNSMWLFVPLFAPALPSRSRLKALIRTGLGIGVIAVVSLIVLEIPNGIASVRSYSRFESVRFQERPANDLRFGLQVFPLLTGPPPVMATERDLTLFDSIPFNAISVIITEGGATIRALDSLSRAIDRVRTEGMTVIATLGYSKKSSQEFKKSRSAYISSRLEDIDKIARVLKPTVIIPAFEPYGAGTTALGLLSPEFWIDFITEAAQTVKAVNPNIYIGMAASSFGSRDSTLYSWAASRGSAVDIPGFSFYPGFDGAASLDTKLRIARRWMRQYPATKPHWIWSTGGFPVTHGERSQLLALRGIIAWGTSQSAVRGIVVAEAGDYTTQRGLQTPSGRWRQASSELISIVQRYVHPQTTP